MQTMLVADLLGWSSLLKKRSILRSGSFSILPFSVLHHFCADLAAMNSMP
jgi:hypothetical protein